jgi:light-regulated signal transduction histidine kinase (bacteriophytochrome)
MSGIRRETCLGKYIWNVLEKPSELPGEQINAAIKTNKPIAIEVYYDNKKLWLEMNIYPVQNSISVFFRDITTIKEFNTTLKSKHVELERKAKELAASNAELEQFAYVASHDLQEPLRMVAGFLTQLEKKYAPQLDFKAQQYIQYAVDGAKRMQQIIWDLLEYSRIDSIHTDWKEVNLNQVVNEVVATLHSTISFLDASIRCENLPIVKTQRTYMIQLFQNLIGNAIKYHKQDTPPIVHVYCEERETEWKISIKDNGIGIDKEYFSKIFELFQRLHGKEVYTGSGLGLAISKKIVEKMGGILSVESELGEGSIFSFTLPKEPVGNAVD